MMLVHLRAHEPANVTSVFELVGRDVAEAHNLLGPPDFTHGRDLLYGCSAEAHNLIRLEVERDTVTAVVWQPYVG